MADNDIAAKIAALELLRSEFDPTIVDAKIAALRAQRVAQTSQALEAADQARLVDPQQRAPGATGSQGVRAEGGAQVRNAAQVIGDHNKVTINDDPARMRQEQALVSYLQHLMATCSALQLARIDLSDSRNQIPMRLSQVYVALNVESLTDVTERRIELFGKALVMTNDPLKPAIALQDRDSPEAQRLPTAIEAIERARRGRLMLLGAPGSGKSTFVNHLTYCLAGAQLSARAGEPEPEDGWLARLPGWSRGALLPVRVVLRDLAAFQELAAARQGTLRLLHAYLRASLASLECEEAVDLLIEQLRSGRAILLFDGLDEVVGAEVLARVVECISAAAAAYSNGPVVITCRVLDYQANDTRKVRDFAPATLAPLDQEQIDQFVNAWYDELAATGREVMGSAERLREAIRARGELRDLAHLPLLLTMMAVVHAGRGKLPDARALLYAECVDLLLLRWRQEPGAPDVLAQLGLARFGEGELLALMAQLGYEAHLGAERSAGGADRPADLSRAAINRVLKAAFRPYVGGDDTALDRLVSTTLHLIAARNGLLLKQSGEQEETYSFPHRSFQEFLAGYYLTLQHDYLQRCSELAAAIHWHEALGLMVGYQVQKKGRELERPILLVQKLLESGVAEQALAGELLNLIGRERAESYNPQLIGPDGLWAQARRVLHEHATARAVVPLSPALRVRAGLALGTLCYGDADGLEERTRLPFPDPRLPLAVVGLANTTGPRWRQALDRYWCPISQGPFWYGDDRTEKLTQISVPYDYQIGRYPITNADYARFIAAGGYHDRRWWTEQGWVHIEPGGVRYFRDEEQRITRPRLWGNMQYNNPLQPVVGVSWYEAAAYCNWLTAQGHAQGWLAANVEIRLPTWLEWQKAARGNDQRQYPWGDTTPTPEHANYDQTRIGATSPVGCFPLGQAAWGALDMAGNAMEWTATPHEKPGQIRVEKDFTPAGAAILSSSAYWREIEQMFCSARNRSFPDGRNSYTSFRIVQSLVRAP